jgi:hypothetical protein
MINAKKLIGLAGLLAVLSAPLSVQADDALPVQKEVTVGVSDAYIPAGFDSDSDAFVVVSGIFPNGCYSWKGGMVNHVSKMTHEVRSQALVSQGMCLMVLIPFSKEIRLGKLDSGEHTLRFLNGDGTYLEKKLTVE